MDNLLSTLANNKRIRLTLEKSRYLIGGLLFLFIALHIRDSLFIPGFIVSLFGELIQVWSYGSLDKNKVLADRGPYCFVRNPVYLGRYFVLLGVVLLIGNVFLLLLYSVIYIIYMINRVKREEYALKSFFGSIYLSYCKNVNRFLPAFGRNRTGSIWYFNPGLFIKNHCHLNLILFFYCYICFYFFISL